MKPVFKIALKTFGFNVFSLLLLFAGWGGLLSFATSVVIQIILAISMFFSDQLKETGQGMLLGVGVFSLVGFSVCTIAIQHV
jgi:hypothetical protein